jgi:D-beta-D-heptose 7-phosphate kinase/D-beta-D-heptose 1-phosphate adenosyltransferase
MKVNNLRNSAQDILILGDVFLDIFQTTDVLKISPERPVPVLQPNKSIHLLGGAANVANNIKSIRGSPFLISKLSNDVAYKNIKKLLKVNKINFKIVTNRDYSSPVKKRIVQNDHQFCRLDNEYYCKLKKLDEIKIINFIKKNIHKFQSLILSDYSKGFLTNNLIKNVINIFRYNDKKVFTDPKSRDIEIYKNSNFICPNQKEFYDFFDYQKLPFTKSSTIKLFKKTKVDAFVVTKGSKGITVIFKKGKKVEIPQEDVNVYDVTGAGDTFIGILSYLLSNKIDLISSLKIASFACGKVVQKKHTAVISFVEFQKIVEKFCENDYVDLQLKIKLWKLVKLKIGVTNGCFDVLHTGHLHLLSEAKKNCDKLIVLLNSDNSIKKIKGKNRPMIKLSKRIDYLKMIKDLDGVEVFEEKTPEKIIANILPDILFKGSDYKAKELAGYNTIKKNGGTVKIIKKMRNFSSSKLIQK